MSKPEFLPIQKECIAELERLHQLLSHPNSDQTMKAWAREKIDHIHKLVFMGAIFVPEGAIK